MTTKNNWQIKKLGEVCDFQNGFAFKSSEYAKSGFFVMRIGNVQDGYISLSDPRYIKKSHKPFDKFILQSGDILVSLTGNVGRVGVVKDEHLPAVINQRVARIVLKNDILAHKEFLYYFLKSSYFIEELIKAGHGAAQQNISTRDIENLELPLPPLAEQKRIVKILDEVFEGIEKAKENAEKNLKNSQELFESYLQNIFANTGKDWVEKNLGDVCTLYQGIAINAKTKHSLVEKSDLPLLRIKDLKNNTVEQYIDPNNYPVNALVNESDIIYTRTGSLGLVFRGKKGVLHNNSFKVVPNPELSSDYLFIWLQNPIFKTKILSLAARAAQPDITHAIFKIQKIEIPPIKEQELIVKKLDALSGETKKLEAIFRRKIADLEELKKSVLKQAFSGEL